MFKYSIFVSKTTTKTKKQKEILKLQAAQSSDNIPCALGTQWRVADCDSPILPKKIHLPLAVSEVDHS